MRLTNHWFTAITESDSGAMIIVCGRDKVEAFRASGKLANRVEITWEYAPGNNGMPTEEEARRMEKPQEALQQVMEKDKLAILTGIYTGDGMRTWIFYTRHVPTFGERLNEALTPFEQLPIKIYTEKDPEWKEYSEMYSVRDDAFRDVDSEDDA
ncbi:MAG: DUF695 domain-containing protein [Porphyromonadaceae bacterium]|nr:DUF695 domain-containing protein [Porphyromonadaceae bacterium]